MERSGIRGRSHELFAVGSMERGSTRDAVFIAVRMLETPLPLPLAESSTPSFAALPASSRTSLAAVATGKGSCTGGAPRATLGSKSNDKYWSGNVPLASRGAIVNPQYHFYLEGDAIRKKNNCANLLRKPRCTMLDWTCAVGTHYKTDNRRF